MSKDRLLKRPWSSHPNVEIVEVNALSVSSLHYACEGCEAVYYLIHSMNPKNNDFANTDRQAAHNMITAAEMAQVKRIIYLGGLGDRHANLSKHLRSRLEVAEILQSGEVPTTTLRAAMIIGTGSASFEILRHLVNHLPIMITPRWVHTECQPIAVRNVLHYLVGCLEKKETIGKTFDIGGAEIVSYKMLMDIYAQEAGLRKRTIIPMPVLSPTLSSYWISFVTPVPRYVAKPLAEGLRNRVVCQENEICSILPQELFDCHSAIRLALQRPSFDPLQFPPPEVFYPGDPEWAHSKR